MALRMNRSQAGTKPVAARPSQLGTLRGWAVGAISSSHLRDPAGQDKNAGRPLYEVKFDVDLPINASYDCDGPGVSRLGGANGARGGEAMVHPTVSYNERCAPFGPLQHAWAVALRFQGLSSLSDRGGGRMTGQSRLPG
ncbi:hypothetical protein MGYG_04847 [Nannizzia gypsea CBS 118893]|uniref:Uncharacterized protein n=1 Tax=Arthroderma gypseum (strain ATCC MYA-4604 / CBS 118893) TaxID=535722 RepID=E4UX48_ARTGP|nr:hypothetical protein MGYG_04847 [Nannizzia gypsea CBS 118893]EFR01848.1 hypothetical protein MGYG_04847 [Nannizzia gypsea CBS 118893]